MKSRGIRRRWKTDRSGLKIRIRVESTESYIPTLYHWHLWMPRNAILKPNTVCQTRLTVVNALTSTANISIGPTIKSISRFSTKIPRYAFIPEIEKQRGIFSIRNRNREDLYFRNLKLRAKTFLLNRFKKSLGIRVLTWFAFLGLQNCISLHRFFTVGYWASVTLCR